MFAHPKNWKTVKVNPKTTWKIVYWFYDDKSGLKKQVKKKGMNDLTDLVQKQDITKTFLDGEVKLLEAGYNPITNKQVLPAEDNPNISTEGAPLCDALDLAHKSIDREEGTKKDIKSVIKYVRGSAKKIRIDGRPISQIPIGQIKKRNIRAIFDYLAKKREWTNNTYNFYRSHLMMVFPSLENLMLWRLIFRGIWLKNR